jgi:Na+-translocating ferredoxin:NAD+ oxidoreductase RnfD subunit
LTAREQPLAPRAGARALVKKIEGRWFLFGSHLTLFTIAMLYYNLPRTLVQVGLGYGFAAATELALHFWLKKYPKATPADRVLSAVSEAAGLLLIVRSTLWYYYAIASVIAVGSKYVFTRHDGVHVFNPTNYAIVLGLALFPLNSFELNPDEYSSHTYAIAHVVCFGVLAVSFGKTYMVTIGYFAGLILGARFAPLFGWTGWVGVLYPELGAFGMIFAFLMITDPRTTPQRNGYRLLFGLAVAAGVLLLRSMQVSFPNFLALFFVTLGTFGLSFVVKSIYRKESDDPAVTA